MKPVASNFAMGFFTLTLLSRRLPSFKFNLSEANLNN